MTLSIFAPHQINPLFLRHQTLCIKMVFVVLKKDEEDQFLFQTTSSIQIDDLIRQLVGKSPGVICSFIFYISFLPVDLDLHNLRSSLARLCTFAESILKDGGLAEEKPKKEDEEDEKQPGNRLSSLPL